MKEKTERINYSLPVELIQKVKDMAKEQERNQSTIVKRALREYFKKEGAE